MAGTWDSFAPVRWICWRPFGGNWPQGRRDDKSGARPTKLRRRSMADPAIASFGRFRQHVTGQGFFPSIKREGPRFGSGTAAVAAALPHSRDLDAVACWGQAELVTIAKATSQADAAPSTKPGLIISRRAHVWSARSRAACCRREQPAQSLSSSALRTANRPSTSASICINLLALLNDCLLALARTLVPSTAISVSPNQRGPSLFEPASGGRKPAFVCALRQVVSLEWLGRESFRRRPQGRVFRAAEALIPDHVHEVALQSCSTRWCLIGARQQGASTRDDWFEIK
jgi:hypothetical protein